MQHLRIAFFAVFALVTVTAFGCGKKPTETLDTPGEFDVAATGTEDLTQLPLQASSLSQQAPVEVLPIEASPVTQPEAGVPAVAGAVAGTTDLTGLNHQQKIQVALKNAGFYTGAIDGKIGPASRKAVEAFQKQNGLKVDGKVGPKTWAVLEGYLGAASVPAATTTS